MSNPLYIAFLKMPNLANCVVQFMATQTGTNLLKDHINLQTFEFCFILLENVGVSPFEFMFLKCKVDIKFSNGKKGFILGKTYLESLKHFYLEIFKMTKVESAD